MILRTEHFNRPYMELSITEALDLITQLSEGINKSRKYPGGALAVVPGIIENSKTKGAGTLYIDILPDD